MIVIRFDPQPDITAFELAQLLKCHTYRATGMAREMFDAMPDNVKRHVVVVSDDRGKKKSWTDKIKTFKDRLTVGQ